MGSEGMAPHILILPLDGDEWLTSRSAPLFPGKNPVEDWVGPTAGLVVSQKTKISSHYRDSNPGLCKAIGLFEKEAYFRPLCRQNYSSLFSLYRVIRNNCRDSNNCPPRSPDATPCDFFLWGLRQGTGLCSSFSRQVSRNCRYESEPPLKPSPLTCYRQFGANWIIVLMFVESQRVHI